jgi:hypothetical protein
MPNPRSIITIAVVSALTFLAIEHFKTAKPATASRVGLSH